MNVGYRLTTLVAPMGKISGLVAGSGGRGVQFPRGGGGPWWGWGPKTDLPSVG